MKGKIKKIIGPVVDVEFREELPAIYNALTVMNGDKLVVHPYPQQCTRHFDAGLHRQ